MSQDSDSQSSAPASYKILSVQSLWRPSIVIEGSGFSLHKGSFMAGACFYSPESHIGSPALQSADNCYSAGVIQLDPGVGVRCPHHPPEQLRQGGLCPTGSTCGSHVCVALRGEQTRQWIHFTNGKVLQKGSLEPRFTPGRAPAPVSLSLSGHLEPFTFSSSPSPAAPQQLRKEAKVVSGHREASPEQQKSQIDPKCPWALIATMSEVFTTSHLIVTLACTWCFHPIPT